MARTLLNGFPASAHQEAIFDALTDHRSGSKMVKAVAGSGKTTTIKNGLRYTPQWKWYSIQCFAFNTDAAQNLKAALTEIAAADGEDRVKFMSGRTFHSVGWGGLNKYLELPRGIKPIDSAGKTRAILKSLIYNGPPDRPLPNGHITDREFDIYRGFIGRLVGLAKGNGIGILTRD